MSRGGSRRGGDRGEYPQVGPDGWAVAGGGSGPTRPPPKAGDLSNFGKISMGSAPMTFGPSSVFAGKKGAESKRESISRTSLNPNMFSMLSSQAAEAAEVAPKGNAHPFGAGFSVYAKCPSLSLAPAKPVQCKRLVLQPRSKPVESENAESQSPVTGSDSGGSKEETQPQPEVMSDEVAKKKIAEDTKEFFGVRNFEEAEVYFTALPAVHHHKLVDSLVSKAVESKEADAQLVAEFFARSTDKVSSAAFEEGFSGIAEFIEDIAIDAPKAVQLFVLMIMGAKLDEEPRARIAAKSSDSDKLLALLQYEFHERKWTSRTAVAAPTTMNQIHETVSIFP
jgi:translation initiation factor 4G